MVFTYTHTEHQRVCTCVRFLSVSQACSARSKSFTLSESALLSLSPLLAVSSCCCSKIWVVVRRSSRPRLPKSHIQTKDHVQWLQWGFFKLCFRFMCCYCFSFQAMWEKHFNLLGIPVSCSVAEWDDSGWRLFPASAPPAPAARPPAGIGHHPSKSTIHEDLNHPNTNDPWTIVEYCIFYGLQLFYPLSLCVTQLLEKVSETTSQCVRVQFWLREGQRCIPSVRRHSPGA